MPSSFVTLRRSFDFSGTTTTHGFPMALAVSANARPVFPADATMTVPPPQSLRRANVGSASICLKEHAVALAFLSG